MINRANGVLVEGVVLGNLFGALRRHMKGYEPRTPMPKRAYLESIITSLPSIELTFLKVGALMKDYESLLGKPFPAEPLVAQ